MVGTRAGLVAAAALVAAALAPVPARAQSSAAAKKPAAELTVHVTAPVGWTGTSPLFIRVRALGSAPTGPVAIADAAGLNQATVTSAPGRCAKASLRYSGYGSDEWCLEVEGLAPGSDSTGTIDGAAMTLKLTLGVRHNFVFLPLLFTLLAFAVGVAVAWYTTDVLPQVVKQGLVDREVDKNATGPVADRIDQLGEWVTKQRVTMSDKTLLPLVQALVGSGPGDARGARERLKAAIATAGLPEANPIRKAAQAEADRKLNRMSDFYSGSTKSARHPADQMILTLNRASAANREVARAQATIDSLSAAQKTGLPAALAIAAKALQDAADDTGLAFAETLVVDLWSKIFDHVADLAADGQFAIADFEPAAAPDEEVVFAALVQPSPLPVVVFARVPRLLEAGFLTIASILVLAAVATAAVASASYFPKATFGSFADYLTLVVSAFASTSVAAVLAVLLLWQRNNKT